MSRFWQLSAELAAQGVMVKVMNRSEAARYAARMRWGTTAGGKGTIGPSSWEGLLTPDGGFTIDQTTGEQPVKGHAVAIQGHSSKTPKEEFFSGEPGKEKGRQILKDWLAEKADLFDNPAMHVGGWHDPDTGEIVLDPVEVISDRATAIRIGRLRNQKAICDLAAVAAGDWANAIIPTGGTGD